MNVIHRLISLLAIGHLLHGVALGQEDAGKVKGLIEQFKNVDTHRQAVEEMKKVPVTELVPSLVDAIRNDSELRSSDWLRGAAYDVLRLIGLDHDQPDSRYTSLPQITQLLEGLSDPDPAIRSICLLSMPRVDELYSTEVVDRILPFLDEEDPLLVSAAAQVLGEIGPRAVDALPRLREILVEKGEAARSRWERARAMYPDRQGPKDVEILARSSAAHARMAIAGVGVDLDLYSTLDQRGQEAVVDALRGPLAQAVVEKSQSPIELHPVELRKILAFLGAAILDGKMSPEFRKKALFLVGWIALSSRVSRDSRLEAIDYVQELSQDADEGIRELARTLLDQWSAVGR